MHLQTGWTPSSLSFAQPPLLLLAALHPGLNKDTSAQSSLEGRRVQDRLMALDLREFKPMARVMYR